METKVVEKAEKILKERATKKEVQKRLLSFFQDMAKEYGTEVFMGAFWELIGMMIDEIKKERENVD